MKDMKTKMLTMQIVRQVKNLEMGHEGVVVIFSKGGDVQVNALGIHPDYVPRVIEKGLEASIALGGN